MSSSAAGATDPPKTQYVKLISSDGHIFHCSRRAAMVSGTIRSLLSGPVEFAEMESGEVDVSEVSSAVLEKVIKFFHYKLHYNNNNMAERIPDFPIEPAIVLDLLIAASYLDA